MNVVVVDPRKLQLEFCQDWASKYWYIVVTVVVVFVAIVVNVAVIVVDPRILSLNSGQNRVNDKWDIVDVFVFVVVPEIYLLNLVKIRSITSEILHTLSSCGVGGWWWWCVKWYIYMVSMCQEQHSLMNFAVCFFKMLPLNMLLRAQFLSEFYAVFCIHQILNLLPL